MSKIVVTGMGAVTPIGLNVNDYWNNLIAGASGVGPIEAFDASDLPVRISAEVRGFDPQTCLSKDLIRNTDKFAQFAYVAAHEAIAQSALPIDPERTGLTLGTAMAGVTATVDTHEKYMSDPRHRIGPRFMPKMLGNIAAYNIAEAYNIYGVSITVSTACASGGDAVKIACMLINAGEADAVVAVGADSSENPLTVTSLNIVGALSKRNDSPKTASRPFDRDRDGFVIGEGGGALVLETEEHALARGAHIFAYVAGCGSTNDAYHQMAPHPQGRGSIACMKMALKNAGLTPNDIDYINAHGTSTPVGDCVEINAVKSLFTDKLPLISSTKGATGHMMGAGGITEIIACIKALETGIIPPTINLDNIDPECGGVDLVPNHYKKLDCRFTMSNAFGFGGQNSSVILGKYER